MGGVTIFAACDTVYYEKYAGPLINSARAHGHRCEVLCSGKPMSKEDWAWHAHFRWFHVPDMLRHGDVLVLDVDSIVRKPFVIPECDIGMVMRRESAGDWHRAVNGGCVYLSRSMGELARKISERLRREPRTWFDDQAVLYRLAYKRGNYKTKIFGDDFFSWHLNPDAVIWTGKAKTKHRPEFLNELERWR